MHLLCKFTNANVKIELAPLPVADHWMSNLDLSLNWLAPSFIWGPSKVNPNEFQKDHARVQLIETIRDFNRSFPDIKFPFSIDLDNITFTNKDLNTIHRYFTTATSHRSWEFNSEAYDLANPSLWYAKLAPINDAVHNLQAFYNTPEKDITQDVNVISIVADNPIEYMHPIGDWKYLDYELEYDVFIQHVICGRDTFQAYIDGDNCKHADVMPQWNSLYNSFYIDVNGERNKHMRSSDFRKWLDSGRKLNTAWQYIPLGKVVSGHINVKTIGNFIGLELV